MAAYYIISSDIAGDFRKHHSALTFCSYNDSNLNLVFIISLLR